MKSKLSPKRQGEIAIAILKRLLREENIQFTFASTSRDHQVFEQAARQIGVPANELADFIGPILFEIAAEKLANC